ncbi:hypothetical protein EW146_g5267 [Bondarzewia mesenterica]|uniref:Uncharacterized protein n=1 Tax=Bondarzewia mesenterica TaxID=1095465 RepID=A0A4S4LT23_9AGAM|nr:hypothetical protein EW146_g5267 [Bondarzewia mesenterica]
MPRMKQTAKKSTGSNAPHRSLFGVASATVAVQDAEKEFVWTVAETNSSSVLQKRSSSRVKTLFKTSAAVNTPLTAPAVESSGADSLGQQLYSLANPNRLLRLAYLSALSPSFISTSKVSMHVAIPQPSLQIYWHHSTQLGQFFIMKDVEFDLNMELNPTSLSVQAKHMVSLAKMLKSSSVDRALIFISTHSNEFTGDLYHEQEGSCTLMDWFMAVITEPLLCVLSTVDAHWFLLSCGAVVNVPESLQLLKDIIFTYNIKNLFAFDAPTFHINLSMMFVIHFIMHVIIEGTPLFDILGHILADSYHLAHHAGILHAYWDGPDLKSRLYRWVHQTARPWGQRLPLQCPRCGPLRSFKVSGKHNLQVRDVVVQCRGKDAAGKDCTWQRKYSPPTEHFDALSKGPGGDWIAMDI